MPEPLASHVSGVGYDRGLTVLPTDEPLTMPCPKCRGTGDIVEDTVGCWPGFTVVDCPECDAHGGVWLAGPVQLIEPCPRCHGECERWWQPAGSNLPHMERCTVCGGTHAKSGSGFVVVAHATAEQVPIVEHVGQAVGPRCILTSLSTFAKPDTDRGYGWVTDGRAPDGLVPGGWAVLLTDIEWITPVAWTGPTEPGWHQ